MLEARLRHRSSHADTLAKLLLDTAQRLYVIEAERAPDTAPVPAPAEPVAAPAKDFLSVAERVAAAEVKAETARAALQRAEACQAEINTRITALATEREQIVSRRTAGVREPDDGPRLSLIDADLQGLHRLLTDVAAATALKMSELNMAERDVSLARQHLALAEDERAHTLLFQRGADQQIVLGLLGRFAGTGGHTAPGRVWRAKGLVVMSVSTEAQHSPRQPRRLPGQHGALPLSERTRQRLLRTLLQRADEGDIAAIELLLKLQATTVPGRQ